MTDWYKPATSTGNADFDVLISPGDPDWSHTGLHVATLGPGDTRRVTTGEWEFIVLPLAARDVTVAVGGGGTYELTGRDDVFSGATDCVYVGRDSEFTLTAKTGGRVALCIATASTALPAAYVAAADVPVEMRGAGSCSRQVQNFGTPGTVDADSIIACEVITPAGNWSSYPPHKHDEERPGEETALEEIYYFELRTEPGGPGTGGPGTGDASQPRPFGYQAVYGTSDRPIDVKAEVASGDVVLVPHGWHGPAMAPPGYDMYYLNVMAGPGEERIWLICDDPQHGWVRGTWDAQQLDPRLPIHEH